MKSIMTKDFSRVAQTEISRSTFDRSHGLKTAFDSGYLVPVEVQEIVPSDTVEMHAKVLARLAPVVTPVMDNVFLDLQAFFVPSRLLWTNFVKKMGERVKIVLIIWYRRLHFLSLSAVLVVLPTFSACLLLMVICLCL